MKCTRKRRFLLALPIVVVALISVPRRAALGAAETLPSRLPDREFWSMVLDFSETNGFFRSDNLLSNELYLQYVLPDLVQIAQPGRAYLGVGPEQNFTYIAAIKPKMAFIIDIRRGNRDLHLMYKAIFELSSDRADFVSRLFARKRPDGLGPTSTVKDIFDAYAGSTSNEALYADNLKAIREQLVTTHALPLSHDDLEGIEYVYHAFFTFGPRLEYASTGGIGGRNMPTYGDLMTATDGQGHLRGFLSSEESFSFLKNLESRNLIVPIVGNFAGAKAIRAVGAYLKAHDALVSAFYLSNVEQFLRQDEIWGTFCGNVASLPLDKSSTFIRALRNGRAYQGSGLNTEIGSMADETNMCVR